MDSIGYQKERCITQDGQGQKGKENPDENLEPAGKETRYHGQARKAGEDLTEDA